MGQKPDTGTEKQKLVPMEQPLKKHGDKLDVGRSGGAEKEDGLSQTGGAGEPQATPLEPEKQGGIGGP
jgi:hypothetical protein